MRKLKWGFFFFFCQITDIFMKIPGHQSNNFYAILQAVFCFCLDFQLGFFIFIFILDFCVRREKKKQNDSESFKGGGPRLFFCCIFFLSCVCL